MSEFGGKQMPDEDAAMLEELARAVAENDPVPDDVVAGAKAAFIARNLDEELAELVYDSARDGDLVLTRGDGPRSLSFATGQLSIELELSAGAQQIMGQIVPPQVAEVELEVGGLTIDSATTDDLGRFRFEAVPRGSIALVCRGADTDWRVCTVSFDF